MASTNKQSILGAGSKYLGKEPANVTYSSYHRQSSSYHQQEARNAENDDGYGYRGGKEKYSSSSDSWRRRSRKREDEGGVPSIYGGSSYHNSHYGYTTQSSHHHHTSKPSSVPSTSPNPSTVVPTLVSGSSNVTRAESNASSTNQTPSTPPMNVPSSSNEVTPAATMAATMSPKTPSSAHITRTFDLEPNAFPPLPGMGSNTTTNKKEDKSSQVTQTASGVAPSNAHSQSQLIVTAAPSIKTAVILQQHAEIVPEGVVVAPAGAWGENRLADVVKGVTKKPLAPRTGSASPPPLLSTISIQSGLYLLKSFTRIFKSNFHLFENLYF